MRANRKSQSNFLHPRPPLVIWLKMQFCPVGRSTRWAIALSRDTHAPLLSLFLPSRTRVTQRSETRRIIFHAFAVCCCIDCLRLLYTYMYVSVCARTHTHSPRARLLLFVFCLWVFLVRRLFSKISEMNIRARRFIFARTKDARCRLLCIYLRGWIYVYI